MKATVLKAADCEQVEASWGGLTWYAAGKLGNSEDMTVGLCRLKPGESNPLHYHPNCSETLVVWQGKIDHLIEDGKTVEMSEGDVITVPVNLTHRARNIGSEDALLFIAFSSPNRETILLDENAGGEIR